MRFAFVRLQRARESALKSIARAYDVAGAHARGMNDDMGTSRARVAEAGGCKYKVVTPAVPSWRTNDDAVSALQWLRKYLRHAPNERRSEERKGLDEAHDDGRGRGARGGAATFQLFRDRQVRVGQGTFETYEDAKKLKRASRSRILLPGEFLCVPDDREGGWYWATYRANAEEEAGTSDEAYAEAIRACVIYRDEHVLGINKPPGLAVMPGQGVEVSVYDLRWALKYDAAEPPRLVHRLDRDTSGVLLLARTAFAANKLNAMFRKKSAIDFTEILREQLASGNCDLSALGTEGLTKTYWALAGAPPPQGLREGWIDAPLYEGADAHEEESSREIVRLVGGWRVYDARASSVIVGAGESSSSNFADEERLGIKSSTTKFKVLATADDTHGPTLLELTPVTGRKHQLRVHCANALASPVVGDFKYGFSDDRRSPWKLKLIALENAARARDAANEFDRSDESVLGRAMRRSITNRGVPLHLHARALRFAHPESGEIVSVVARAPKHFRDAFRAFALDGFDDNEETRV